MRAKFFFDHPKREQKKRTGFARKIFSTLNTAVTSKSMPPYPAVPSCPNNI